MFNLFNRRANGSEATVLSPQGTDNRPTIGENTDYEKMFAEYTHPNHQEVGNVPDKKAERVNTPNNNLSTSFTPTPEAGVRYPDMSPFEKREIFRHDARKMIYNRGRRYAMAYITSEIARKFQVEFLVSEYEGIMNALISGLEHEVSKKQAVYDTGNELVKEQLEPVISDMNKKLTDMQEHLYKAGEEQGEVQHAIKSFNRGWDLGAMRIVRNIDLKDQALDDIDAKEEGGEL